MNDVFNSLFSFQITKAVYIHYGNLENADETKKTIMATHINPQSQSEHLMVLLYFHKTNAT